MQSLSRALRRGNLVKVKNKITGETELFRKGNNSLVFTGHSFKEPKSEINL
jgi:hypothetical protein